MDREARVRLKLAGMSLSRIRYVINAGAVSYAIFAIMHSIFLRGELRETMLPIAVLSSVALGFTRWFIKRPEFDIRYVNFIELFVYGTFVLNSVVHVGAAREIHQSTNVMLCILGCGVFFNRLKFGVPAIAVSCAFWILAIRGMANDPLFVHFAFGIFTSVLVGIAFLNGLSRQAYSLAMHEVEAEDKELMLAALSNASLDALLIARGDRVIGANKNLLELLGLTESQISQLSIADLFPENSRDAAVRFILGSESGHIEVEMRGDGDKRIPVAITHKPLSLSGVPVTAMSVRTLLDGASAGGRKADDSSLRTLAAGVAHEINNPLTITVGHLTLVNSLLAAGKTGDKKIPASLDIAMTSLKRMAKTVTSLMAFATTSDSVLRPVEVSEVIESSLSFVRARFTSSSVVVRVTNNAEGLIIPCRGQEISQVLISLLANSLDAIKNLPNPEVLVAATHLDGMVAIRVIDSGSGIPQQVLKNLFTPFFTTKPPGSGQGLSLSVARKQVQDHGGTLEYIPDTGKTAFEIKIPIWTGATSGGEQIAG